MAMPTFVDYEGYTVGDAKASVGPGWHTLVECVFRSIAVWNKEHPNLEFPVKVVQVKEKWGGLRIYTTSSPDEVRGAVDLAEDVSFRTCEDCGALGTPCAPGFGWIRTLCPTCVKLTEFLLDKPAPGGVEKGGDSQ